MERDSRKRPAPGPEAASAEPTAGKRTLTAAVPPRARRDNELAPVVAPRIAAAKPKRAEDEEQQAEPETVESEAMAPPVVEEAPAPRAAEATVSGLPRLDLGRRKS